MINIIHDIMMPFLFLFSTGLRISEFCGRTVKDLDFEEKVINVDHQLQRSHNMKYYIESTKTTSGTRKIPMTEEVKDYCRRTGQKVPETLGEIATVIYTSLAVCYAKTAKELEEMTGRTYSRIHIVGGGSNAGYLNELTAKATKKEIHAGPGEATAIGNITAQMLKAEEYKTIEEARTIIHESFGVKVY